MSITFAPFLLVLPLIGGLLPLLFTKVGFKDSPSRIWVWITLALNAITAILALGLLPQIPFKLVLLQWLAIEDLSINWTLNYDFLSASLVSVVCIVSTLVQLYSVAYMKEDLRRVEFHAYLSLFSFAMLLLVTANNLLQMFIGWEGVGICSFILIGFWHYKISASQAAFKALVMNRIGDTAFILAIAWIFMVTGSFNIDSLIQDVGAFPTWSWWIPGSLLLIAAMAKSAQFGLHTWLPDAMEGPTPVSALLHAATMVTAGIYLLIRFAPLLDTIYFLRPTILIIGSITALLMGLIALNQYDIKKIIAYSTGSQLGFMMMAIGLGNYMFALFHLVTHAFFKCLLFLGAGTIIHYMYGEHDIRHMGGLWKQLPLTYTAFLTASLSMAGIPFLAGYYSKESILLYSWSNHGLGIFTFGLILSLLTSAYTFRLFYLIFHGDKQIELKKSQGYWSFRIPLVLLALLSSISGQWLAPLFQANMSAPLEIHILPTVMSILGVGSIITFYILKLSFVKYVEQLHNILVRKLYIDEVYTYLFIDPFKRISILLAEKWDLKIMDQSIFGSIPNTVSRLHELIKKIHSGYLPTYMALIIVGFVCIITYLVRNIL